MIIFGGCRAHHTHTRETDPEGHPESRETCDTVTVRDDGEKTGEGTRAEVKDDDAVNEAYRGQEMGDNEAQAACNS
ncbi:MAG: hypothetical protein O3A84_11520 [Proteobacteria bacterium]|nr:hypothetical protein [Pseudomonadota bacterium]